MTKPLLASLGGLLLAAGASLAAEPALARHTFIEPHMGTRFKLILYAPNPEVAEKAARAAFARIAALDGIMSDYRPTSELMQLCKKAGGDPVPVSAELFFVLSQAQQLSSRSEGAFDVTIGPVVKLWRLARKSLRLPDPADLRPARTLVDFRKVWLDPRARTVQLRQAGMQLDLGGIAKGYAADEAIKVLKEHGITRALVAAGGDIVVGDPPPGKPGWQVAIYPLEPAEDGKAERTLTLSNAAVSTSGDAEQYLEIDGKRYSHIVDPRTGIGLVGRMSVTVIAPNGTTSDSLATAVCVLGPEKGLKLVEETEGAAALFVRKTEAGTETVRSRRFPKVE